MIDETLAARSTTSTYGATTGVPDEPPTPRQPPSRVPDDDEDEVPSTPPTEPTPVPIQDPPAEPGGNRPQIV